MLPPRSCDQRPHLTTSRHQECARTLGGMTERKPAVVSFETWIDRQIREAQERGEFDNLAGTGKPIPGIDRPADELWWVKQLLRREGITVTPTTLKLRKDVETMFEHLGEVPTEAMVRELVEELNARIRRVNRMPVDGPPSTLMPFDVDHVVERWRGQRAAT